MSLAYVEQEFSGSVWCLVSVNRSGYRALATGGKIVLWIASLALYFLPVVEVVEKLTGDANWGKESPRHEQSGS